MNFFTIFKFFEMYLKVLFVFLYIYIYIYVCMYMYFVYDMFD